jgi:hypothetical protein
MKGLLLSIILFFFSTQGALDIQFNRNLNPIKTIGNHPRVSLGGLKPFVFINTPDNRTWLFQQNGVWMYEYSLEKWTFIGKIEYDDPDILGSYNPYNEEFLFWSRGVGKVYTWKPGNDALERIDRSDLHKTQYGHFGFVDPSSGNIYAFGGSGFWQDRSFILEFDLRAREWNIVPLKEYTTHPQGRRDAIGMYDPGFNQLHIFGGYANPHERHDKGNQVILYEDYWVFDFNSGAWSQKKVFGKTSTSSNDNYFPQSNFISTNNFDRDNELIWYLASVNHSDQLQLLVYDLKRDFGTFLPAYVSSNNIRSVTYDRIGNQLILHNLSLGYGSDSAIVQTLTYSLPSAEDTRTLMDSIRDSELQTARIKTISKMLFFVIPFGIFILVYVKRRANRKQITDGVDRSQKSDRTDTIVTIENVNQLTIEITDTIRVLLNGENVRSKFTHPELDIFVWLAWKNSLGDSFQSNQMIERLFWTDSSNPGYTRKQRNLTMNRLNDQLELIFSKYTSGKSVLITRSSYNDKRKKEYGLDFHSIGLRFEFGEELKSASEPHGNEKKLWLEMIKDEYRR